MLSFIKAVLVGVGFVACYFLFVVFAIRMIYFIGFDPYKFEFLQWPLTFPLHVIPDGFWTFVSGSKAGQKNLSATAVYLLIDVAIYSVIAFVFLHSRRKHA